MAKRHETDGTGAEQKQRTRLRDESERGRSEHRHWVKIGTRVDEDGCDELDCPTG